MKSGPTAITSSPSPLAFTVRDPPPSPGFGHTSIRTTLDVYGHLFEGYDQAAADALDVAWRSAREAPAARLRPEPSGKIIPLAAAAAGKRS